MSLSRQALPLVLRPLVLLVLVLLVPVLVLLLVVTSVVGLCLPTTRSLDSRIV